MIANISIVIALLFGGGFVLVFAGLGAYLVYRSVASRKQAGASQEWPGVEGQVASASVSRSMHSDSEGNSSVAFSPNVEYSYEAAGQQYRGEKISFGFKPSFNSEQKAQSVVSRYPVGSRVTVYYDPANPAESVLEKKSSGTNTSLVLGIIFLVVSICVACPVFFILLTGVFTAVTRTTQ